MFPNARFLMFFIVPMPAWAAVGGIFAVSVTEFRAYISILTDYVFPSMIYGPQSIHL